jgi:hypothetical protein
MSGITTGFRAILTAATILAPSLFLVIALPQPGEWALRGADRSGMPLQLGELVEGLDAVQLAGVNQAHEQVAHSGPVPGLGGMIVVQVQMAPKVDSLYVCEV